MKFYFICAKLFNFWLKNTKKKKELEIRDISPKKEKIYIHKITLKFEF